MARNALSPLLIALALVAPADAAAAGGSQPIAGSYRVHRAISLQLAGKRVTPRIWTSRAVWVRLATHAEGEQTKVTLEAPGRSIFEGFLAAELSHPARRADAQRPTTQLIRPHLGTIAPGDALLEIKSLRPAEARALDLHQTRSWGPFGITRHLVGKSVP